MEAVDVEIIEMNKNTLNLYCFAPSKYFSLIDATYFFARAFNKMVLRRLRRRAVFLTLFFLHA